MKFLLPPALFSLLHLLELPIHRFTIDNHVGYRSRFSIWSVLTYIYPEEGDSFALSPGYGELRSDSNS